MLNCDGKLWRNLCPSQFVIEIVTEAQAHVKREKFVTDDVKFVTEIPSQFWNLSWFVTDPSQSITNWQGLWRVHHNPLTIFFSFRCINWTAGIVFLHFTTSPSSLHLPRRPQPSPHPQHPLLHHANGRLARDGAFRPAQRGGWPELWIATKIVQQFVKETGVDRDRQWG